MPDAVPDPPREPPQEPTPRRAGSPAGPEAMRQVVRDYVAAVHATYLDHVRHLPPGERGALPLLRAEQITVVAASARRLHLVATAGRLPAPVGPEVAVTDDHRGARWTVRFYDPSVLPQLGLLAEDPPQEVRRLLGIVDPIYHLVVAPGGGLDAHHAQHSGVALANLHAKTTRDLERLRRLAPDQAGAVDELGICVRIGLDRAAAHLARELTRGSVDPPTGTPAAACIEAVLAGLDRR